MLLKTVFSVKAFDIPECISFILPCQGGKMQNSGKSVPPGVVNEADGGKFFFQRGLVEIEILEERGEGIVLVAQLGVDIAQQDLRIVRDLGVSLRY